MRKTWGKTLETIGQNNEWNSMRNTEKNIQKTLGPTGKHGIQWGRIEIVGNFENL